MEVVTNKVGLEVLPTTGNGDLRLETKRGE